MSCKDNVHPLREGPESIEVDYEAMSLIHSLSTQESPRPECCSYAAQNVLKYTEKTYSYRVERMYHNLRTAPITLNPGQQIQGDRSHLPLL